MCTISHHLHHIHWWATVPHWILPKSCKWVVLTIPHNKHLLRGGILLVKYICEDLSSKYAMVHLKIQVEPEKLKKLKSLLVLSKRLQRDKDRTKTIVNCLDETAWVDPPQAVQIGFGRCHAIVWQLLTKTNRIGTTFFKRAMSNPIESEVDHGPEGGLKKQTGGCSERETKKTTNVCQVRCRICWTNEWGLGRHPTTLELLWIAFGCDDLYVYISTPK